jgi:hypothetical protein
MIFPFYRLIAGQQFRRGQLPAVPIRIFANQRNANFDITLDTGCEGIILPMRWAIQLGISNFTELEG